MFSHYFTTAIRNVRNNKLSFFINLIGLSLGLASAFIISSYVLKETSFDRFHSKSDRIARVLRDAKSFDWTGPNVPYIIKEHIDNSIPMVEKSCMLDFLYMAKLKQGEEYVNFRRLYASTPEFFDIFDCELLQGSLDNPLSKINSLVINRKTAEKYFPNENPIGKTFEIKIQNETYQLFVDAVIEDFPPNSSFKFDALCNIDVSLNYAKATSWMAKVLTSWEIGFGRLFVLLKDQNTEEFQVAWDKFEEENKIKDYNIHFHLQSLTDIHLNSDHVINDGGHGNKVYIYLFSSIAFVILLVAAFNYIILSISISKMRYKEIGVKKILGSQNGLIRKQFLTESIILSAIAFPVAYILAFWSVDFLNQLFNISLEINIFKKLDQLFIFFLLLLLIGVLAGSYVAFYLSRLNPLEILKSKLGNQNKKIRFQYVMLLFQIMVFTGLTGASFSIYKQIDYLRNAKTGINLKNKLFVSFNDVELNESSYHTLHKLVSDIPEVKNFALGWAFPPDNNVGMSIAPHPEDETKSLKYEMGNVTFEFFDCFDVKCVQGRVFDPKFKDDSSKIVMNESAVKLFGFKDPIGKMIKEREIIGVIKDFHLHTLHGDVAPTMFTLVDPKYMDQIAVQYHEGLAVECMAKLKQELEKCIPDAPIEIMLYEDKIDEMYSQDSNLNNIIIYFSLFAIVIALIGIFGQSLFAVRQQVKEIGIRKVNGATSRDIVFHVLKKYILLCVIANLISWPFVYVFIDKWQEGFAYKSPFSIWLVLFTLVASIVVVIGTVVVNAWRASRINPVEVLKYE